LNTPLTFLFYLLPNTSNILFKNFLPHPWDVNTFAEIYHFKWAKVSFTLPSEVEHLAHVISTYLNSFEVLRSVESEGKKEKAPPKLYRKIGEIISVEQDFFFLMIFAETVGKAMSKGLFTHQVLHDPLSKRTSNLDKPSPHSQIHQTLKNYR
jgi:hypothetical protein